MNRTLRRGIIAILTASLAFTPAVPASAKKKVALSTKKITLTVGKQKKISLKNATKKVKWSIVSGKKVVKLKSKKKKSVVIAAKKAGNAKVQAKLGKKKYLCKVKVGKAAPVVTKVPADTQATQKPTPKLTAKPTAKPTPTKTAAPPVEKDKEQAKALKELIQSVIEHTNVDDQTELKPTEVPEDPDDVEEPPANQISTDLNDTSQYTWKNGKLTEIIWNDMGITGVLSLEAFPDLQTLICSNNKIAKLDLSGNPELHELNCAYNWLTDDKFSISSCEKLMILDCSNNHYEDDSEEEEEGSDAGDEEEEKDDKNSLTKLDLSKMQDLELLNCSFNSLKSLNISASTKLIELNCSDNMPLTTLKVSNNPELTSLNCNSCDIETLDVSKNPALEELLCNYNSIEKLDLKNNPELKKLDCERNSLSKLNTGSNPKLEELICSGNGYTNRNENAPTIKDPDEEDDTGETVYALRKAIHRAYAFKTAGDARLSEDDETLDMDVSKNKKLKILKCADNALLDLDISKNTELEQLDCSMNYLQTLDLSQNPKLIFLKCQDNDITALDLTNLEQNLSATKLYCDKTVEVIGNDK